MKVFWTQKASKQLDQIFEYIASDSHLYANRTVGNIIQEAESIMSQPRKGRKVPEYEHEDIKEVFGSMLIGVGNLFLLSNHKRIEPKIDGRMHLVSPGHLRP